MALLASCMPQLSQSVMCVSATVMEVQTEHSSGWYDNRTAKTFALLGANVTSHQS